MNNTLTGLRAITRALTLGVVAVPMAAQAAGYIKIPDIPGESRLAKDSGEAHLDYLKITLNADGVETEDIGFKANDETETTDDHSSGAEHEIEYDIAAGAFKQDGPQIPGVSWQQAAAKPKRAPRDAATGLPTGKRQHKPLSATKPLDKASPLLMEAAVNWRECRVGRSYEHIMLGDGEGKEYRIEGVRVTRCDRERVSFTYQKIAG